MKKILITGANSYIGESVEKWLLKESNEYHVETLDMEKSNWKEFNFNGFDVVFHVAGIAHISKKKNMEDLYYKVNRDLTMAVAKKSKNEGVNQFIFISSMIVYNSQESKINEDTYTNPDNFYGKSKLEAEEGILPLADNNFKVVVLRPPMIYGPNSKGNFSRLYWLAHKTFVFPKINNRRSVLFIDNLSEFIKKCIEYNLDGIYFPQNKEIISTSDIVLKIRKINKRRTILISLFNPILRTLSKRISVFNKLFSDSYYEANMSKYSFEYQIRSFDDSIVIIGNENE